MRAHLDAAGLALALGLVEKLLQVAHTPFELDLRACEVSDGSRLAMKWGREERAMGKNESAQSESLSTLSCLAMVSEQHGTIQRW